MLQATQVNIWPFGQKISKMEPPLGGETRATHGGATRLRRTSVLSQRVKTLAQADSPVRQNTRPFWAAPPMRRKFGAKRRIAQGWLCRPEHFNHRRVEPPSGRQTQKRETRLTSCLSFLVEAGGVEPPSENSSMGTSPGADGYSGGLAPPVPLSPGKPSRLRVR